MHLAFIPYGIKERVDLFLMSLQCQMYPWIRKDINTGEEVIHSVQGALRPSMMGIYEYVFPKEALGDVLASMGVNKDVDLQPRDVKMLFRKEVLRKMLKLKKVPKKYETLTLEKGELKRINLEIAKAEPQRVLFIGGVRIFVLGIRDDKVGVMKNVPFGDPPIITDVEQEML